MFSRQFAAALPVMAICSLIAFASPAKADLQDRGCSERTLQGDYGFSIEGTLGIPNANLPPGLGLSLRGVALRHFDGHGHLTQVDHVVVNFLPPPVEWNPGYGTYTVNADCTGTEEIFSTGNPPLKVHIVIVKDGRQVKEVVDTNAVSGLGEEVEVERQF